MLIERFPKSRFYNSQVASLGFDYESIADFGNAANWYEKLFTLDKDHEGAADALYSAALFRQALGDWSLAVKDYQQFITAYPKDERVTAVTLDIAKLYEDNEQWTEASKVYYTFFTKPPADATVDQVFFARLRYGLDLEKLDQGSKAAKHWKETLAAFEAAAKKGVEMELTPEFAARIMYKQAQDQIQKYMAMKIDGPGPGAKVGKSKSERAKESKLLLKQLTDKAKSLQEVEATFATIISTGAGEWGLAGLVQLGKAYENMATSLRTSYIPPLPDRGTGGLLQGRSRGQSLPSGGEGGRGVRHSPPEVVRAQPLQREHGVCDAAPRGASSRRLPPARRGNHLAEVHRG